MAPRTSNPERGDGAGVALRFTRAYALSLSVTWCLPSENRNVLNLTNEDDNVGFRVAQARVLDRYGDVDVDVADFALFQAASLNITGIRYLVGVFLAQPAW